MRAEIDASAAAVPVVDIASMVVGLDNMEAPLALYKMTGLLAQWDTQSVPAMQQHAEASTPPAPRLGCRRLRRRREQFVNIQSSYPIHVLDAAHYRLDS